MNDEYSNAENSGQDAKKRKRRIIGALVGAVALGWLIEPLLEALLIEAVGQRNAEVDVIKDNFIIVFFGNVLQLNNYTVSHI